MAITPTGVLDCFEPSAFFTADGTAPSLVVVLDRRLIPIPILGFSSSAFFPLVLVLPPTAVDVTGGLRLAIAETLLLCLNNPLPSTVGPTTATPGLLDPGLAKPGMPVEEVFWASHNMLRLLTKPGSTGAVKFLIPSTFFPGLEGL